MYKHWLTMPKFLFFCYFVQSQASKSLSYISNYDNVCS